MGDELTMAVTPVDNLRTDHGAYAVLERATNDRLDQAIQESHGQCGIRGEARLDRPGAHVGDDQVLLLHLLRELAEEHRSEDLAEAIALHRVEVVAQVERALVVVRGGWQ